VSDKRKTDRAEGGKPKDGRLTIGLVADDIVLVGGQNALRGIIDAARDHDVNLLCFHQRAFQEGGDTSMEMGPASWDSLAEVIDGLVIYQSWPSEEAFAGFRRHLPSLPIANALRVYAGCPGLAPDAYRGTKELTCHLIEVHGYSRIAFVAGPEGNWAVEERYRGYVDALAEHDVSLDPNLVTPHLGWGGGNEAIRLLMDERALLPGTGFEAVVTSNDTLALGMLDEFRNRGVRVPDEVAVVGFDDDSRAACSTPPLTTTRLPAYEIGRQAAEVVLAQMAGEQVPEQTLVPPKMVVRRSCGCQLLGATQTATGPALRSSRRAGLGDVLKTERANILSDMVRAIEEDVADVDVSGWVEQMLDGFAAELGGESKGGFLAALNEVLGPVIEAGGDESEGSVTAMQKAISVLRHRLLPYLNDETLVQAEDLWQQARVALAEIGLRAQARAQLRAGQQAQILREIGAALNTTFDVEELMTVLIAGMPRLGIPDCYLSLYESAQEPSEWSRLILAYNENGRVELEAGGQRFRSQQLAPEGVLPDRQYSFVVEPLYFREHQLGFVLLEVGPRDGVVYDVLRGEISSALQGALLLRERERAEEALEQAYAEVEQQVQEQTAELEREVAERERAQEESVRLQQEVIEAQKQAIQELSSPIIPIMERIIIVPLIGSIDSQRARDITRRLLGGIREHRAKVVILDITGLPVVDSGVADHLNKTIQAARLKGARAIVTGISDAVAETIVDLGIDWSDIETLGDLKTGLQVAMVWVHQYVRE
jgi:DNA-binding LacI/PurR family transcriptional regulator/anti-anti-sigma regulatory factor